MRGASHEPPAVCHVRESPTTVAATSLGESFDTLQPRGAKRMPPFDLLEASLHRRQKDPIAWRCFWKS